MKIKYLSIFVLVMVSLCFSCKNSDEDESDGTIQRTYQYAEVEGANPLKGLFPYNGKYTVLPHSMEHLYFPFEKIMTSSEVYDFSQIDSKINEIALRGHQTVLRIYLDYPDKSEEENGTPDWIYNLGVEKFTYTGTTNGREIKGTYPDYSNEKLHEVLKKFIEKYAEKYDGNPKIAFIEMGLIGHWGEWHNSKNSGKGMPTVEQKKEIFSKFSECFRKTFVLARYPDDADKYFKDNLMFGFHDDSFSAMTFGTKTSYFVPKMQASGTIERYKTAPIGGEMYPSNQEAFGTGNIQGLSMYQDFSECAEICHTSFMKCSKVFNTSFFNGLSKERQEKIKAFSNSLGYNLTVTSSEIGKTKDKLVVKVKIKNKGLARFYYKWKMKILLLNTDKTSVLNSFDTGWDITSVAPESGEVVFSFEKDLTESNNLEGNFSIALIVENPLVNGTKFKFSNKEMDFEKGWMVLN